MGKILSKPKMPSAPVYVVEPTPVTPVGLPATTPEEAPEPTADEQRLANILRRQRGRLGTIATSSKGVLNETATPARKTLLGE